MRNLIILFTVIAICVTISCQNEQTINAGSVHFIEEAGKKVVLIADTTSGYICTIKHPLLTDEYEKSICDTINSAIKSYFLNERSAFITSARYVCKNDVEMSPILSSFYADYTIVCESDKYFSIRFNLAIDWSNAPNPSIYYATMNYDLEKKEFIDINNFAKRHFDSDEAAIQKFSLICFARIYNPLEVECQSFWKSERRLKDFEFFNICDTGIYFIFDDYTLDSHICGNPEIFIPYNDL